MFNENNDVMRTLEIINSTIILMGTNLSMNEKKQLIDALANGAKLTKADAGRVVRSMTELEIYEHVFRMSKKELIEAIAANAKLTKADAGRMLGATVEQIQGKLKTVFGGKGQ
jgi:nucleoid DNA-binding protein